MIPKLAGPGYLLADKGYHSWDLLELARLHGQVLISPRKDPEAGLGKQACWRRPVRLALLEVLEVSLPWRQLTLAQCLFGQRGDIERDFGNATSFSSGLPTGLPAWVRRLPRVRRWVLAKLLINACRIRLNRQQKALAA